ncbi:MAG: hypothetical protein LBS80_00600, partial [Tannerella sp.]|nr:hypothetical protein [Tannerella sp.]
MNKKIFGFIAVIALAVVAAVKVSIDNRKEILSSVALENVEALTQEDSTADRLSNAPKTFGLPISALTVLIPSEGNNNYKFHIQEAAAKSMIITFYVERYEKNKDVNLNEWTSFPFKSKLTFEMLPFMQT